MKKQDFKRQLAAIMALAVTFSSVPPVWADENVFLITDDDITLNSISTIGMETNAYDLLVILSATAPLLSQALLILLCLLSITMLWAVKQLAARSWCSMLTPTVLRTLK